MNFFSFFFLLQNIISKDDLLLSFVQSAHIGVETASSHWAYVYIAAATSVSTCQTDAELMDSIWEVWSVCTYTDYRSDCGDVTCEAASDRSLQIKLTWAQFWRACSQTSALSLVSIRACCSATTSPEGTRQDREGAGPSSRLGSVRVWQPGCCRTQARLRCGWGGGGGGWWLSSLSGSNWDESTDGTTAVDGYFALVYSGTKPAAVLDIFAVSKKKTGYRLFIVLLFCRIADASHHMV